LFYDYLVNEKGVSEDQIIKIELDQRKYYKYRNPIALCEYVEEIISKDKNKSFYLFVDEVQFTKKIVDEENGGIEVTVYDMLNEFKGYKNLDVYVTGSNSHALSQDIATEFRGRATQIHIYPLSFAEYYSYVGGDERKALDRYMLFGGLPRVALMEDEKDIKPYLISLYNELYIKDIVERHGIERVDILGEILNFLSSQISSLTNPLNIANTISSQRGEKINQALVSSYMDHITDSFLIAKAQRYDVKGKTYFNYPNKYYYTDIGLRNARLNYRQFDVGHIMENLLYNELVARGYSVDVGVVYDRSGGKSVQKEIDFVVNDTDRRIYIQSAFQMSTEGKSQGELQSLKLTKDFFKKIIIRMDISHNFYDDDGILHCSLIDVLLNRVELF
jgi:predicted AAA+ superfamily ATPase